MPPTLTFNAVHLAYVYAATDTCASLPLAVCRVAANKTALAARVDAFGKQSDGSMGRKLYEDAMRQVDRWQEAELVSSGKVLARPDEVKGTRRGGRRMRAIKARQKTTEMQKLANRLEFGTTAEDTTMDGEGLGMLGAGKSVRGVQAVDTQKLAAQSRARLAREEKKKGKSAQNFTQTVARAASARAFTGGPSKKVAGVPNAKTAAAAAAAAKKSNAGGLFGSGGFRHVGGDMQK